MGSSDQETSPRRSLTAMDSGACTASGSGGGCRGVSHPPVVRAREAFDKRPHKRPRLNTAREPAPASSWWAGVPSDILGVVLRLLPCHADRASVRAVCCNWRRTTCVHALPPPLPMLVLNKLRISCLTPDGKLTAARRSTVDDVRCVGSSEGWLVALRPSKHVKDSEGECFLVNAFSNEVVHLPPLSAPNHYPWIDSSMYVTITNTSRFIYRNNDREYQMVLRNVVLSASPNSGSKCIVAARSKSGLALCQPGMTSWYLCRGDCIVGGSDLAFYQGKLYMLWRFTPRLFAFDLRENEHGIYVSRVEPCMIDPLLYSKHCGLLRCNIVVWRGKMLLIIRYINGKKIKVGVFALDFSTYPCGITEIYNFDGDCILVDACGFKFFSPGLHVGVQGDLIYFTDKFDSFNGEKQFCDTFMYNMNDGTRRPFAVELSPAKSGTPESNLNVPVWLCPSK